VLALIPDSSSQGELEEPLQALCRLIDSVGGVWQVTYSEAADLPAALEPLFRTQPEAEPEWEARTSREGRAGHVPKGSIRRAALERCCRHRGDLLVMLDDEIVRLSGIGPAIWEAASEPASLDRLAKEVGKAHGRPEGYVNAVASATAQLISKAVLEQGRK
jgi:hypothetical protein